MGRSDKSKSITVHRFSDGRRPSAAFLADWFERSYFSVKEDPLVTETRKLLSDDITFEAFQKVKEAYFDGDYKVKVRDYGRRISVEATSAADFVRAKWGLESSQFFLVEASNKILICILETRDMSGNQSSAITADMYRMNYFVSQVTDLRHGAVAVVFEPLFRNGVKPREFDGCLLHWTPRYNLDAILSNGLVTKFREPKFGNGVYYPPRVYMLASQSDEDVMEIGRELFASNKSPKNDGHYVLLEINIPEDSVIDLFPDPHCEGAFFSYDDIPPQYISVREERRFYPR